jgi:hypothetical protein
MNVFRAARVVCVAMAVVRSMPTAAQSAPALPARLGTDARATIQRIIDSARAVGLPSAPLADKAAEGVLKGADDARIVAAVRSLARELGDARGVLGGATDPALLAAAASALHAGATSSDLQRLRGASDPDVRALTSALVTLVDLVAKQISVPAATSAVSELLKRRATGESYAALRLDVERDIRAGVAPETALTTRMRSQIDLLDAPLTGRGVKRPPM